MTRFSALQRAEIAEIGITVNAAPGMDEVSVLFNEPKLLKCIHPHLKIAGADTVSVLFNEPKLLKCRWKRSNSGAVFGFSALQRAEIAEISPIRSANGWRRAVSVLFNEPKLLKWQCDSNRY